MDANQQFRCLIILHIRTTLLSDVFATAGYAHGRTAIGLLQTLMGPGSPDVVADLGSLHRASIWENVLMKAGFAERGINPTNSSDVFPPGESPTGGSVPLPEAEILATTNGAQPNLADPNTSGFQVQVKQDTVQVLNAAALKHVATGLPNALAPFFQGTRAHL